MSEPLAAVRRRFAEQIGAAAHLPAPLVDAFAAVPRERFLDPGPWLIWNEGQPEPVRSPDADPARVYVNACGGGETRSSLGVNSSVITFPPSARLSASFFINETQVALSKWCRKFVFRITS